MTDILSIYGNSIPAWLLSVLVALIVLVLAVNRLLGGKLGEFLQAWLKSRIRRQETQQATLLKIVQEMIQERSKEMDAIERRMAGMEEKMQGVILHLRDVHGRVTVGNTTIAQLYDEIRAKMEDIREEQIKIREQVKSLYAAFVQRDG